VLSVRSFRRPKGHMAVDDMLPMVLHDLRTPISSIHGYTSVLLTGEFGSLNAKQRTAVQRLHQLGQYATALVTHLTEVTSWSDWPYLATWQPVDLKLLVQEVCQDLAKSAARKQITFETHLSAGLKPIWGQRTELIQLLMNMTVNAIKFTPMHGRVTITVRTSGRTVHVIVKDTGVGMPAEVVRKLFREFYQHDRPEVGAVGGTGVGLAIIKRIVRGHEGTVSVRSGTGRGTTFHVQLPIRSSEQLLPRVLHQLIVHAQQHRQEFTLIRLGMHASTAGRRATRVRLEQLERLVWSAIRTGDRCYTLPTKRTILIIERTGLAGAHSVIHRLKGRLQLMEYIRQFTQTKLRVGTAVYPRHGRTSSQLLKMAQQRMVPLVLNNAGRGS
jgi:anti-sigma regulatory factor (Ser/Thr protein kinase)